MSEFTVSRSPRTTAALAALPAGWAANDPFMDRLVAALPGVVRRVRSAGRGPLAEDVACAITVRRAAFVAGVPFVPPGSAPPGWRFVD